LKVAIAGGHGKIGRLLEKLLSDRGDHALGLIRNPDHAADLREQGAEPVLCDLEAAEPHEVAEAIAGSDAIVFAAGAGPGSGVERKWTMDYGGAVKLIEAAKTDGISRYLIVSSMGAADPPAEGGDSFAEYLRAKAKADQALMASGLDYTIVRPGMLSDDPPTGLVSIAPRLERGDVSRADVAAVLLASLDRDGAIGCDFDLIAGETAIEEALDSL
jgi:uncharacterized protein YbjT (DUF2867 family)